VEGSQLGSYTNDRKGVLPVCPPTLAPLQDCGSCPHANRVGCTPVRQQCLVAGRCAVVTEAQQSRWCSAHMCCTPAAWCLVPGGVAGWLQGGDCYDACACRVCMPPADAPSLHRDVRGAAAQHVRTGRGQYALLKAALPNLQGGPSTPSSSCGCCVMFQQTGCHGVTRACITCCLAHFDALVFGSCVCVRV
jgi:hypothetical protein